jgi:hypothetical protein
VLHSIKHTHTPDALPCHPCTPAGTLLATEFLLFAWVETKRWYDIKNPGSQGDGSFFGITDDFKGKENGYPGEPQLLAAGRQQA